MPLGLRRQQVCVGVLPEGACLYLTWERASIVLRQAPEHTFQMRICLSLVPPPVARTFICHGHHATA